MLEPEHLAACGPSLESIELSKVRAMPSCFPQSLQYLKWTSIDTDDLIKFLQDLCNPEYLPNLKKFPFLKPDGSDFAWFMDHSVQEQKYRVAAEAAYKALIARGLPEPGYHPGRDPDELKFGPFTLLIEPWELAQKLPRIRALPKRTTISLAEWLNMPRVAPPS